MPSQGKVKQRLGFRDSVHCDSEERKQREILLKMHAPRFLASLEMTKLEIDIGLFFEIGWLPPATEMPLDLTLVFSAFEVLTFIMKFLPPTQADLHLDLPIFEVQLGRDQGKALLLCPAIETFDLPLVEQEFARPERFVVVAVPMGVGADVEIVEEHLLVVNLGVAVLQVGPAIAQRLHLRTDEDDPCLEGIGDFVIDPRHFVLGDDLDG